MATVLNPLITNAGLAAATSGSGAGVVIPNGSGGFIVVITHVALGAGAYSLAGQEGRTALVDRKEKVAVASGAALYGDAVRIAALFPGWTGTPNPYTAREIGFYSGDPDAGGILVAVFSSTTGQFEVVRNSLDFSVALTLDVTRVPAGSIVVNVDTSAPLALALMSAHVGAANPHPQYLLLSEFATRFGSCAGINVSASFLAPPPGVRLLKRNGQAVSRTTYAALDAAIWCGSVKNNTAQWGYRCTDSTNPSATRDINGGFIVLPNARGRFDRNLSDGGSLDSGRDLYLYQDHDYQSHSHPGIALMVAGGEDGDISGYAVHGEASGARGVAWIEGSYTANAGGAETRPYNTAQTAWISY